MASSTAWKANVAQASEHRSGGRSLKARPIPFLSLILTVPFVMAAGAILHYLVRSDTLGRSLTPAGLTLATMVLSLLAWSYGESRKVLVRAHVTVTVALTGLAVALTVAIGIPKWWAITEAIIGIVVAGSWGLPRTDALRQKPGNDQVEADPLTKKL